MVISAINALTLSPALCAVLPVAEPRARSAARSRYVLRGIDYARDGYAFVVRKTVAACGVRAWSLLASSMAGAGWLFKADADRISCPPRTRARCSARCSCPRARRSIAPTRSPSASRKSSRNTPGVAHVTSVVGYSLIDGLTKSNSALLVMTLKPFDERKDAALSADGIIARLQREFHGIRGGDRLRLQSAADHRPRHRQRLRVPAAQPGRRERRPILRRSRARWCSPPTRIPRSRACSPPTTRTRRNSTSISTARRLQTLGVDLSDVFNALQSVLGSSYVNDFNLFGRTWQVQVQGEASDRARSPTSSHQRAQQERRHGVGPRLCERAPDPRTAIDHSLQQLPQRHAERRSRARPLVGRGDRGDGSGIGQDPAARLQLTSGPEPRCRRRRRPARPR